MDWLADLLNALLWMTNFLIIPALTYGSTLALGALGVTLIFGILRFANFAHGEMMAFGAMIALLCVEALNGAGIFTYPVPAGLIFLPVAMVATAALGVAADKLVFSYYRKVRAVPVTKVIASVGVMFFLNGLIRLIKGPELTPFAARRSFPEEEVDAEALTAQLGERAVRVDEVFGQEGKVVEVSPPDLYFFRVIDFKRATGLEEGFGLDLIAVLTIGLAVIAFVALFWFLGRTRAGKAMRAFSDNEDLALLSGVDPQRVVTITWIIAGAYAAIAGTMYGMDKGFLPISFLQMLLPIFAATIVGGIGKPEGAIVGGYLIAFSEVIVTSNFKQVANYVLPEGLQFAGNLQLLGTEYKFAVSFIILVAVLLIRPTGIFKGRLL